MLTKYLTGIMEQASKNVKTIVLPEGEDKRVLTAAHIVTQAKAAKIIILGDENEIKDFYRENNWSMEDITVLKPETSDKLEDYTKLLYNLRKEKGMTEEEAHKTALNYNYFGTLMVKAGDADGMVSGANHSTADTVRPALQIIKSAHKDRGVSSFLIMVSGDEPYLLSDCGVVINPNEKELADIALTSAETAIQFGIEPKVAMLSFSTYGSGKSESVDKVRNATILANLVDKVSFVSNISLKDCKKNCNVLK